MAKKRTAKQIEAQKRWVERMQRPDVVAKRKAALKNVKQSPEQIEKLRAKMLEKHKEDRDLVAKDPDSYGTEGGMVPVVECDRMMFYAEPWPNVSDITCETWWTIKAVCIDTGRFAKMAWNGKRFARGASAQSFFGHVGEISDEDLEPLRRALPYSKRILGSRSGCMEEQ